MGAPFACTPEQCLVTTNEIHNAKRHGKKSQILSARILDMPVKCWIQYLPCYPKHQVYVPFLSFGELFTQMSCTENKNKNRKSSLSCQSSKRDQPFIRLLILNAIHPQNTHNVINFTINFLCKYGWNRNDLSNLGRITIQTMCLTRFVCCQMYRCAAIQWNQPQKKNFDDMNPEACNEQFSLLSKKVFLSWKIITYAFELSKDFRFGKFIFWVAPMH